MSAVTKSGKTDLTSLGKPRKNNTGRKWFDGRDEKEITAKLEEAAQIDASVSEMLFWADISDDSYRRYLKAHPRFADKLAKLREKPVMLARQTVVRLLAESYTSAMDYLKRKRKDEFGDKMEVGATDDLKEFLFKMNAVLDE